MPAAEPFVDTSVLAKRYLDEVGSDEFELFLRRRRSVLIARLAMLELHSLLRRRIRTREISPDYRQAALADFADDVQRGFIQIEPLADRHAFVARDLIEGLPEHPLRALDALHLAIAQTAGSRIMATADRVMAGAADALGFEVHSFG